MSPPLVAASGRDLDVGASSWPDFEWSLGPCPDEAGGSASDGAADAVEPFDYEVHGTPSSVFGSGSASLEDPLLLSHMGPDLWSDPAAEALLVGETAASDAYA